jgi:hypothetical protein
VKKQLDALLQLEPAEALDPEQADQFAAIGIVKDEKLAPDARLRAILDEAMAVGNATSRTIGFGAHPTDDFPFYDGDTAWWNPLQEQRPRRTIRGTGPTGSAMTPCDGSLRAAFRLGQLVEQAK